MALEARVAALEDGRLVRIEEGVRHAPRSGLAPCASAARESKALGPTRRGW